MISDETLRSDHLRKFVAENGYVKGRPNLTLQDLVSWLKDTRDVDVCKSTVSVRLHEMGFSYQQFSKGVYFDVGTFKIIAPSCSRKFTDGGTSVSFSLSSIANSNKGSLQWTITRLRQIVPKSLSLISQDTIARIFAKCKDFESAYQDGHTGKTVDEAVKVYKSHRE